MYVPGLVLVLSVVVGDAHDGVSGQLGQQLSHAGAADGRRIRERKEREGGRNA